VTRTRGLSCASRRLLTEVVAAITTIPAGSTAKRVAESPPRIYTWLAAVGFTYRLKRLTGAKAKRYAMVTSSGA
jgi:hypothetical protein